VNSRGKGCRGEREWRDQLRNAGFVAWRSPQFSGGGADSPDVCCPSLPTVHWEVKRVERPNVFVFMQQAERDAGAEKLPVVALRRNATPWVCIVRATDFLALLKAAGLEAVKRAGGAASGDT